MDNKKIQKLDKTDKPEHFMENNSFQFNNKNDFCNDELMKNFV